MQDQDWGKVADVAGTSGLLGLVVGIAAGIVSKRYGDWRGWVRGLVSAVLVGALVGLGIHDSTLAAATQGAVIGACAFVAPDILDGLMQLASLIRADPIGFVRRVRNALRGGGQ